MVRDSRSDNDHPDASPPAIDPRLHERVVAGDPVAIEYIWTTYYFTLAELAQRRIFDAVDREDVAFNLTCTLLSSYIDNPAQYQPDRGKSLGGYLRMALEGDINNHLAKMKRRGTIVSLNEPSDANDDVGDDDRLGNMPSAEPGPEEDVLANESDARVQRWRRESVRTPEEDAVFQLQYIDNERATKVFAEALGLGHLPPDDQSHEVQKIKDRVATRLRRLRQKAGQP